MLKGRQIGLSDASALEMVLISSGLVRFLNRWMRDHGHTWRILPHNSNVVSKRDVDAKDVIAKAKAWVERLRQISVFRPFLEQPDGAGWSKSEIVFRQSGFRIISETQNPDALRSKTGHAYLDEFAFYRYQAEIWTGGLPSTESLPGLRITIISTPNGTAEHFYRVYTNADGMFEDYARHKVDIYDAVDDGYPVDIDKIRAGKTADDFDQENACKFLGAVDEYFPVELLDSARAIRPQRPHRTWLGIDVASVVDTTAVTVLREQDGVIWLGDTYVIARTPYETNEENFRLGQKHIVDALITHLEPEAARIDVTGDKARRVMGTESLYMLLRRMTPGCKLSPQHISKGFKDDWVGRVKTALTTGKLRFEEGRADFTYTQRNESEFKGAIRYDQRITPNIMPLFMDLSWQATGFDFLKADFQRVYRKWIGPNQTTFDTRRVGGSHGDAFWSVVLGFSGLSSASQTANVRQQQREIESIEIVAPEYSDYF